MGQQPLVNKNLKNRLICDKMVRDGMLSGSAGQH